MLQLGKEVKVQALGKTYTFGRLELRIVREFRDWIREQLGDPFDRINDRLFDKLPQEEQVARIREAEDIRDQLESFSLSCPLAQRFMQTELGVAKLGQLLLSKHHAEITEDEAFAVIEDMGPEKLSKVLDSANGEMPGEKKALSRMREKPARSSSVTPNSTGPTSTAGSCTAGPA